MIARILLRLRSLLQPNPAWYGLAAGVGLTILGISAIGTVDAASAEKQLKLQLPIALLAMVLCMLPRPRAIGRFAYPLLVLSLLLLIFLILPGVPRSIVPIRNGAKAWINLGVMSFQPSEAAKIAFVLALAWYLRYRDSYRSILGLLVPFLIMLIPVGLILKEPDMGQAMLFAPTLFAMLLAAGAKLRHLGTLLGLAVVVLGVNIAIIAIDPPHQRTPDSKTQWMHVLASHQEKRIAAMMWPERYKNREAFQQIVGTRLVGAGGVTGVGEERARVLVRANGLPEPHNDMICSVIAVRWGLFGIAILLGLYTVLILSFLLVAGRSKDPLARLVCTGFAAMIFSQVTINVGMNVGLIPIIGITLPFVSYGGSSLLATFAMLGLVLNFASRRPTLLARPSFEFDQGEAVFQ